MTTNRVTGRVDAHHHLWRYTPEEYGWIDDGMRVLRRDFLLDELAPLLGVTGVERTVAVQARQSVEETRWLLSLSREGSPIGGVVGWLPIATKEFPSLLNEVAVDPALKGLRHGVQAEGVGFLDGGAFNAGVRHLLGTGLVYDILILWHQLPEAIRFVDRHPDQVFVLDHLGKPPIGSGEIEPWAAQTRDLGKRPNVACKLSGMVTEADPAHWTAEQLTPYVDVVLEAFGPERLMIGSDWPVLTLGCEYGEWWRTVESWTAHLSSSEGAAILGGTASRVYRLQEQGADEWETR